MKVTASMKRQEEWQDESSVPDDPELQKKTLRNLGKYLLKASTAMIKNQIPKKLNYQDAAKVIFEDGVDSLLVDLDLTQSKTIKAEWKVKNNSS